MKRLRFASSLAAFAIGAAAAARAAEDAPVAVPAEPFSGQAELSPREVFLKTGDAVCRIEADDEHGHLRGTGFFIDADGTLLTSYSVGGASQDITVAIGEQRYPATRLVADARAGLAVLKIVAERPVRFLKFGKSTELAVASPVMTVGYPLDLPLSPSIGLVAGFDLKIAAGPEERFFATRHIRANVPVQRGQGGSPVLNLRGEAVGILISTVEENCGIFALPSEAAQKILHDFRTYGRIRQGWVGVDVRPTDKAEAGSSARILKLREDSPAFMGGIRPGDILLKIGARKVTNPEDAHDAAFFVTASESLPVLISREGKQMELTILPLDPPDGSMPTIEREKTPVLSSEGPAGLNLGK